MENLDITKKRNDYATTPQTIYSYRQDFPKFRQSIPVIQVFTNSAGP